MAQQERGGRRWRRRAIGLVSIAAVGVLTLALLAAYWKYRSVWTSINHVTVTHLGKRPPQYNDALNLLVFASGSTDGLTRHQQLAWGVGDDDGDAVSETIMVVHISPGRHRVTVLNIPRDTVVPVYNCASGHDLQGQHASPGAVEQIDNTLSYGGPSCLWKTVEHQTGIRIDHFVEMGYAGVIKVVNDIGGVHVCLPFTVHNPQSGLRLSKGEHHIDGVQFLKFWRTRENIGNGSDLQRIQRDDYLLARALDQALHENLFSSPSKLFKVVSDGASQLTLDSGFSQSDILHLGESLRGLPAGAVQFIEAPTVPYPANTDWVLFAHQDHALFRAIARDRKLPSTASKHPAVLAATASPSQVRVAVLNGSGIAGQANKIATGLAARGFHITSTGDAAHFGHVRSVIEYNAKSALPKANALAKQIPGARLKLVPSVPAGQIDLIVGSRTTALAPTAKHTASVSSLAKKYGGITGSETCNGDTQAFTGPLSP
jgi:LCP family protein required for cell wall assembly